MSDAIVSVPTTAAQALITRPQASWHPVWFAFLSAVGLTVLLNGPFLAALQAKVPGQYGLQLSLMSILFLLNLLLLILFSFRLLQKPVVLLLFAAGAFSYYFMDSFGIVVDKAMLQNAVETDAAEAAAVLSISMFWQVTALMLFPVLCSSLIRVKVLPAKQFFRHWLTALLVVLLSLFSLVASGYAELAPFFRNYKDVKHLALPVSPVAASVALSSDWLKQQFPTQFVHLGQDAIQPLSAKTAKPRLIVMVLGETARADHFQLNGYARSTNPQLSHLPVFSFHNVSSCGTATAHSVPCLFSNMGREQYDEAVAKNSSNLLDILSFAGIEVSWLDNNSGCKGVCNRLETVYVPEQKNNPLCSNGQCLDRVLLEALELQLKRTHASDRLIVLHQLGSHGPEYFRRSAAEDKAFLPECTDKQLQLCATSDVVNAYDNSIVATDHLLADLIRRLGREKNYQTAMLYVSDHGESLGENGIYLHGLPYWMAPAAQTHVPLLWWMSEPYALSQQLSADCVKAKQQNRYSHDNIFHTLLGLFGVNTRLYQANKDILHSCG